MIVCKADLKQCEKHTIQINWTWLKKGMLILNSWYQDKQNSFHLRLCGPFTLVSAPLLYLF